MRICDEVTVSYGLHYTKCTKWHVINRILEIDGSLYNKEQTLFWLQIREKYLEMLPAKVALLYR